MTKVANILMVTLLLTMCLSVSAALANDQSGQLVYNNKPFTVSIGEISLNDEGKTTVEVLTDLEVLAGANDGIAPMFAVSSALKMKIVVGNKTYQSKLFGVKDGGLVLKGKQGDQFVIAVNHIVFHFEIKANPSKIILFNSIGPEITFDAKTLRVIK